MATVTNDSTVKTQTTTANTTAANQNIKTGKDEFVDGSKKVAKGLGAKAKDAFSRAGSGLSWVVYGGEYSPGQLFKAAPGLAKAEFNNITTARNGATHRGMLGALAGAALCATAAYGMIVFDKTIEILFGLLLHDLLIYAAVAASIYFVAQALIRLFRVTNPVETTDAVANTTEGASPSVEDIEGVSKAQADAGVDATPPKAPSKADVEARKEEAKAAYDAAVAKKAELAKKKDDVKNIDEELSKADKEIENKAIELGYHSKFEAEFDKVVGSVDLAADNAKLRAALEDEKSRASKIQELAGEQVDTANKASNEDTVPVEVTTKKKVETETTVKTGADAEAPKTGTDG